MTEQDFLNILTNIFRLEIIKNNNLGIEVKYEDLQFKMRKKRFRDANDNLKKLTFDQGYELYNKNFYEASLTENSHLIYNRDEAIENDDNTNKLKYILSLPSDEYLLVFLKELQKISSEENNQIVHISFTG